MAEEKEVDAIDVDQPKYTIEHVTMDSYKLTNTKNGKSVVIVVHCADDIINGKKLLR